MATVKFLYGFNTQFLGVEVPFPILSEDQQADVAPVSGSEDNKAHYINYSLQISKKRGFPYYTAANIDGNAFKKAPRMDSWRIDKLISTEHQWGPE